MPSRVYNNVVDQKILVNNKEAEDVKNIGLPTFNYKVTTVSVAGMVMDVEVPDQAHLDAAELTIAHNNGRNCIELEKGGTLKIEGRIVREVFNAEKGIMDYALMKVYASVMVKGVEKGTSERGNPYGSTVHYAILRYEEWQGDKLRRLVDAISGNNEVDGKQIADKVQQLLA